MKTTVQVECPKCGMQDFVLHDYHPAELTAEGDYLDTLRCLNCNEQVTVKTGGSPSTGEFFVEIEVDK